MPVAYHIYIISIVHIMNLNLNFKFQTKVSPVELY